MQEFRVTFGQKYRRDPHPHLRVAHPDGWLTVLAHDEDQARAHVMNIIGREWSMMYGPQDDGPTVLDYPRGELLRVIAPGEEAFAILTAEHEGQRLLVYVWGPDSGEVSTLDPGSQRWGLPTPLTAAP